MVALDPVPVVNQGAGELRMSNHENSMTPQGTPHGRPAGHQEVVMPDLPGQAGLAAKMQMPAPDDPVSPWIPGRP